MDTTHILKIQNELAQRTLAERKDRHKRLYRLVGDAGWLRAGLDSVLSNRGSSTPGIDGVTKGMIDVRKNGREKLVQQLREELLDGDYQPQPVLRTYIPKTNGKLRPLGIATLRDRTVQATVKMVLEPVYESVFHPFSWGFRPLRSTHHALSAVRRGPSNPTAGFKWIIEGDIAACFDAIRHDHLMTFIQQRVADRQILMLVERFLKAGVLEGGWYHPTREGVPQGSVVSPLFANLYLHHFDLWWWQKYGSLTTREKTKRRQSGLANSRLVRFADDWLLLTNGTRAQAEELREEARQYLWDSLGLELNMEKTHITHAQDGFEFVGFHLQWLTPTNRKPWLRAIPTPDNIERFKAKIRQMTNGRQVGDPYLRVLALNRILRGWILYYRHANVKDIAHKLDWWVYRRFTHWLKRHHGWGVRRVLAEYEQQQYGRRKNLAVCNEHRRSVFLYRMSDLPLTRYRTRNYPNPYIQPQYVVTQVEGEPVVPLKANAWQGGSRHAEWQELRRQILQRDGYTCQYCGHTSQLEAHHIRARHKGGTDSPENLVTLCEMCHAQIDEYRAKFA